jgi:ABC-type transport system substrate-binding protein
MGDRIATSCVGAAGDGMIGGSDGRFVLGRRELAFGAATLSLAGARTALAGGTGKFVTANNNSYDTLDPHVVFDIGRIASRLNLYDALVRWTDDPPKLNMWLAEKVDISPDALSYTFTLKDAKFHDGSPVTADDVVYSMERILALKKGAYGLFSSVVNPGTTKAIDAKTVRFTLTKPYAVFMAVLPEMWVVNSKMVRAHEKGGDWGGGWLASHEAGSGSFRLAHYDPAVGFSANRFADHFAGWGPKYLDQVEFLGILEVASRVLGLEKGEFDALDGYTPYDQIRRMRGKPNVQILAKPSLRTMYFIIHNRRPPLDDVNMRRALCYAFDYDGFINNLLDGSVARNAGIIPDPMWGAPKDLQGYTYDLDKAKAALAKVKGPLRTLTINALGGYPQSGQAAELLQSGLAKIGVTATILSQPWPVVDAKLGNEKLSADLIPLWRSAYFADPDNWTGYIYNSKQIGRGNSSFFSNARFDELTDKALVLVKQGDRQPLYEEASRILVDQAAGLFIYNTNYYGAFDKRVRGVRYCPIGDAQDMRWQWLA